MSILIFFTIWINGYSQIDKNIFDGYQIIKAKHIDFYHNDSVFNYTVFIEPSGYFYFSSGLLLDTKELDDKYSFIKGETIKDTVIIDSEERLVIHSRFSDLLSDSNSILNHYPHDFKPMDYYYEIEYSLILSNLREPKISTLDNSKTIRLVIPKESSGVPRDYYTIRIDLSDKRLVYKEGKYDSNQDYHLLQSDSSFISTKQADKVNLILSQNDFENEKYFTEVGVDIYPKYLIEFSIGSDYYVFEKQLFSRNKNNKELNRLVLEIITLKDKVIK